MTTGSTYRDHTEEAMAEWQAICGEYRNIYVRWSTLYNATDDVWRSLDAMRSAIKEVARWNRETTAETYLRHCGEKVLQSIDCVINLSNTIADSINEWYGVDLIIENPKIVDRHDKVAGLGERMQVLKSVFSGVAEKEVSE